jgi:tetratricopeptide (TPR) repeat protein
MLPDFYLLLAYQSLRAGENERALELCNEALNYAIDKQRLGWQCWALYFKGMTLAGMKSMAETQRTADELKKIAEKSLNEKDIRWYYHLMGLIELEKKNISSAVEYFEKAIFLLNFEGHWSDDLHALFIEPLALAYYQSGDLEKSRQEYEKIVSLTKGRLYYGDIYAKSFSMLGNIYEQQGDRGKAIENYEKFLDLWKEADPDFPEVQDAKNRLDELKLQ